MPTLLATRQLVLTLLLVLFAALASAGDDAPHKVVVPERVAALLRPILDLRADGVAEYGEPGRPTKPKCLSGDGYEHEQARSRRVAEGVAEPITKKTALADEALVVLMCYYTGASGNNEDEVINRGRRMLPYLSKYENRITAVPKRAYSDSIRVSRDVKDASFKEAIDFIRQGRSADQE